MIDKIVNYIEGNFEKKRTLFFGYIVIFSIIVSIDSFVKEIFADIQYRIIIYIILFAIWSIYWMLKRNWLPKNTKNKIGLVICINTENDKQKTRLNNDFVTRINDLILKNGLSSIINVINLEQSHSFRVSNILTDYVREKSSDSVTCLPDYNSKNLKLFSKVNKRINGHFYIWGNIKERQDIDNKYYINIDGLVVHNPFDTNTKSAFQSEVIRSWIRDIEFKENIEFKGFLISAEIAFIAVEYITGLAALFSGDLLIAEQLHTNLERQICNLQNPPPNIRHINGKLKSLILDEYLLIARAYQNTDLALTEEYIRKIIERKPDHYGVYLLKSIIAFSNYKNPQQALDFVKKAEKYANGDGIWRYNMAFLQMYLEDFENAYRTYRKIAITPYPREQITLDEVFTFNNSMLSDNSNFCQSNFIIGYLMYKKKFNYPEALFHFEEFVKKADSNKFEFLRNKALTFKNELEGLMELK